MPMTPTRHVPQISHWRSRLPGRFAVCLKERRLLTPLARRSTMYFKHAGGALLRSAISQLREPSPSFSAKVPRACTSFLCMLQLSRWFVPTQFPTLKVPYN